MVRAKSAAKHEAILNGAADELLAHGFDATSMSRVADAAGVSKATIYAHFGDKDRLFEALIRHLAHEKLAVLRTVTADTQVDGSPAAVLSTVIGGLLRALGHDPKGFPFLRLMLVEARRRPAIAEVFARAFQEPIVTWLKTYLTQHRELRIADPEAVARIVFATVHHHVMVYKLLGAKEIVPVEPDRLVAALVALITERVRGASAKKPARPARGSPPTPRRKVRAR